MRALIGLTALLLSYFVYGFYVSQMDSSIIPVELKPANPKGFYDYRGVSNVQTSLSSGSSSPIDVISDAKTSGIDFLILTDKNHISGESSQSGYHGNLLVFDEGEYSFLDSRLLLISPHRNKFPTEIEEFQIFFTDLLSQKQSANSDELVILAHPFNPNQTWTGPYPTGLDGLEILNSKSISKKAWEQSKINVLWSFLTYPFNARLSFLRLFREPIEELALWDQLQSQGHFWGYAGADANAKAIPLTNYLIKFPSYSLSMEVFSNHVLLPTELTGNFDKDRHKIFQALKNGQFYTALDLLGNPKGFIASLFDREDEFLMGSKQKYRKGQKIVARLPIEPKDFYEIVLFKNGDRETGTNSQELVYEVKSPGVYRVVVRVSPTLPFPDGKKWISWIYTNPFFIE